MLLKMKKYLILFVFNFCFLIASYAKIDFSIYEDSLAVLAPKILNGSSNQEKQIANKEFISILKRTLSKSGSYDYPFTKLKTIAVLRSTDNVFRIFNWNLPLENGKYMYYCIVQVFDKKKKSTKEYELIDSSNNSRTVKNKTLTTDNWYGSHYYQIITSKRKSKKYYTLLGWDGNNKFTTKKIIDVLFFDKNNEPRFGLGVFDMGEKVIYKRVVFEYTKEAVMSLKYHSPKKTIVFDNIAPMSEELKGVAQFSGPDGRFNAFKYKKGNWLYIEDYDARNAASILNEKKYNTPK